MRRRKTKNEYSKAIFGMLGNEIDNTFASETQNDTDMKNMLYFFISNLLLVALLLLTSCGRNEDNRNLQTTQLQKTTFRLVIADSAAKNRLQISDTSSSGMKAASQKSTDDLIQWSEYSTLNGN